MRLYLSILLISCVLIVLSGCAGAKEVTEEETETTVELSEVETFDPLPYRIEPREEEPFELVHGVPEVLMEPSDSSRGKYSKTLVIRSGFRIQIFSGENKSNADERLQEALSWWNEEGENLEGSQDIFPEDLPIRVVYNTPYYKVRIGDFLSRQEAQRALELIREEFPDAWIVPDQIERYQ